MKASEMANEQIADAIESSFCASSSPFGAMMREAAARLRRPTPVDDDLLKMAKDLDAKDAEIAKLRTLTTHTDNSEVIVELQRRLKEAEGALTELRACLKEAEEICNREIACRQKTAARCEMCREDSSAGEDCPYNGEPCGCNSPTYGEFPSEKECEPFVAIIAAIRGEGGNDEQH